MVSLSVRLSARAHDMELAAHWHAERAELDAEHALTAQVLLGVAIALRVVAEELAAELEEAL